MNIAVKYPYALSAVFLWIGFVGAISFMEAWLKFRAPGVTLPLGLGIGRLVFGALNKVEWVLALIILANFLVVGDRATLFKTLVFLIPVVILVLQSFWFLPALDTRAELHITGAEVPHSTLHYYYVGMEMIKITCLFIFGSQLFRIPS